MKLALRVFPLAVKLLMVPIARSISSRHSGLFAGGGEILRLDRSEVPRHRRRGRRSPRPRVVRHHPTRLPVPGGASRRSSMRRRLVSSDASPTPSGATICGDNGTTRSPGSGLVAVLSVRRARATPSFREPHVLHLALLVRLAPADGDESPAAGGPVGDVGPAAITASNRHRSRATWSDSIPRPRPRRRGRWQVTKVCGPLKGRAWPRPPVSSAG